MNDLHTRIVSITALLAAVLIWTPRADAQLRQIDQTVFGMDCAPCAHAMEQSLGRMDGVQSVSVSLNSGLAAIDLSPANEVTYERVRSIVRNGGFEAKDATLTAEGTLERRDGGWILRTPAGEAFALTRSSDSSQDYGALEEIGAGGTARVSGVIEADRARSGARWLLAVERAGPAS